MNEVSKLIEKRLLQADIDDTVSSIRPEAFIFNNLLKTAVIPDTVTSIGYYAFSYSGNMAAVFCMATTPPTLGQEVFYNTNDCPIYVPSASVSAYQSASVWSDYSSRIQAMPLTAFYSIDSYYCETDQNGTRTGNIVATERDMNPISPTYGQTRTRTYADAGCDATTYFEKVNDVSEVTSGKYLIVDEDAEMVLTGNYAYDTDANNGLNGYNAYPVDIENGVIYNMYPFHMYVNGNSMFAVDYDSSASSLSGTDENGRVKNIGQSRRLTKYYNLFGHRESSNFIDVSIVPDTSDGRIVFRTSNAAIGFDGHFFNFGASTSGMALYKLHQV